LPGGAAPADGFLIEQHGQQVEARGCIFHEAADNGTETRLTGGESALPSRRQAAVPEVLGDLSRLRTEVAVAIVAFASVAAAFFFPTLQFAIDDPGLNAAVEGAIVLASLFGALVLVLFPSDVGGRTTLLAAAIALIGLSALIFGSVYPLLHDQSSIDSYMYAWLVTRTGVGLLIALAFVSLGDRPVFWARSAVPAAVVIGIVLAFAVADALPTLAGRRGIAAPDFDQLPAHGLTATYWIAAMLPLALFALVALAAMRAARARRLPTWLAGAVLVLAASQFHTTLSPSAYTSIVTTADLLRLAFVILVVVAGVVQLRRIAEERERYLSSQRRRAEARSAAILDAASDGIVTVDGEGRILDFNPAAEQLFRCSRTDAVGRSFADMAGPLPDVTAERDPGARTARAERVAERADGHRFPVEVTIRAIMADGPPAFACYIRDLTERVADERRRNAEYAVASALAEARTLAEATPAALAAVGTLLEADEAVLWICDGGSPALRAFDVWRSRPSGFGSLEGHLESSNRPSLRIAEDARTDDPPRWRPVHGSHGRQSAASNGASPWQLTAPITAGAELVGVVELYAVAPPQQSDRQLEALVGMAAQIGHFVARIQVEEALRHLSERAILRGDFASMVAHELGSPLAAIRAIANVVATGDLSPEEQARALRQIESETGVLSTLVSDMHLAAAADRAEFPVQLRCIPLAPIVAAAVDFGQALAGDHLVRIIGDCDAVVVSDDVRILQVMRNLLSNAAKYSPPGTPVDIVLTPEGAWMTVAVRDRGVGISSDEREIIFEKFGRGRARNGGVAGLGLGLYVSRRIVEAHGSELEVESEPGRGSVFSFRLLLA
jgi:PAS domain S-box-containing protein